MSLELAVVLCCVVMIILACGWRLTWLATRLDRAHLRTERTWAALDAALVRRAQRALECASDPAVDPATTLLIIEAATVALDPDLDHQARERAESELTQLIGLAGLDQVELEAERSSLARRLHNDAVTTARRLRARRLVRVFRLAGHAGEPRPFEMVGRRELLWPDGS